MPIDATNCRRQSSDELNRLPYAKIAAHRAVRTESWPRKFGRSGRWSFCLMTGTLCPSNQERS